MSERYYYLLTALPALHDLGAAPPMTLPDLLERVAEAGGPVDLCRAVALGDDLLQRDAVVAGELDSPSPAVLRDAQMRGEEPLPEDLRPTGDEEAAATRLTTDLLWTRYFRWAAQVAASQKSVFLDRWIGLQVGLRNALAVARAKSLGLDPQNYVVAPELADGAEDFGPVLAEWATAPNPLVAQRVLDRALWNAVVSRDEWFSFASDEVAAYTAKLMLVHRWWRLSQEAGSPSAGQKG